MLVVLVLLVLTTIIGIAATHTGITEVRIARFDRIAKRNFYNAEAGLNEARANFERIYDNTPDAEGERIYSFKKDEPPAIRDRDISTAGVAFASPVKANGIPVAWIEIRAILLKTNKQSAGLTDMAESIPSMKHVGPPPQGSGTAAFVSRRFAITSTAIDPANYDPTSPSKSLTGVSIQGGIQIVENKNKVLHLIGL